MKNYDALDKLVPKTQELHRAIFDTGYEQGFEDGANSEYDYDHAVVKAYNEGEAFILDMLRKEIELIQVNRDKYSQRQNDYCDGCEFTIKSILEIIDKYKEGFILPLPKSEEK